MSAERKARRALLSPRWFKVVRDLWSHKMRTLLVVASIAVGVFAVAVVLGGRAVLLESFSESYAGSVPAEATFRTSDFGQELLDEVRRQPYVQYGDGRRVFTLRYTQESRPTSSSAGWDTLSVAALPDFGAMRVQKFTQEEGTQWQPGPDEIVIERSAEQVGKYRVGDEITVETAEGGRRTLRISAIAHDINAFPAMFVGEITGYVSMESLKELDQPEEFNQLLTVFEGQTTRARASRLAARLRDRVIEPAGVQVLNTNVPNPGSHFLGDIFKAVSLLLLALGVLALALSGFLVVTTISAIMAQQVRQVGIMKAIGGRREQVASMYLTMVFVYGALAVAVGLPIGWTAGKWFIDFAAGLLNFPIYSYIPGWYVLLLEIAVGIAVPLLAAAIPVRQGATLPVARALSQTGISAAGFGHGLIDRALGLLRGLPRPVALSLRNTFLRKGRLAMTLATLVLASAVVMAVFTVRTSILQTVDDLSAWWRYDTQISFDLPQPAANVERQALKVPGVTTAETWLELPIGLKRPDGSENQRIFAIGIPPTSEFVKPRLVSGRWLKADDKKVVVVNSDLAKDEPQLRPGNRVMINVRGKEEEFEVVGLVQGQLMGPVAFMPKDTLDGLIGGGGSATSLLAKTEEHTSDAQDTAAADLEDRLSEAGIAVAGSETQQGMVQRLADELGILVIFLAIMGALLALVGVIGLTGTMTINVLESTREIGVMRSIGASHSAIFGIFMTEAIVIAVMAWAAGALVSWPLSVALSTALGSAMKIPLTYVFSWQGVGIWLGAVIAIAAFASILPAWRAAQISVRDAIAYE
jgi:putative ABC transport system permease protein